MSRPRIAIVLFNLGGPDRPEAVGPFLRNLFSDPAILRVGPVARPLLARLIAARRTGPATQNYALLGGSSPLLGLTQEQARALEAALPELDARCFVAMRYWHPMSDEVAREVAAWKPSEVLLLPLYPHFSTTTTGSSLAAWREAAARVGLVAPVTTICCYPDDPGYVGSVAAMVRRAWDEARAAVPAGTGLRVLFSAHGLPESIVRAGDPYEMQIRACVASVIAAMDIDGLDSAVCFQSRVTPQRWLSPSTETEIERAAHDKVAVLVVPIAFVSDHSETLVELDVEYRELAEKLGVPGFYRAPVANADPAFIASLAGLVRRARDHGPGLCALRPGGICGPEHRDCPHRRAGPQREAAA
ncbi:MAG: ferrochelatase [Rhodospirillales bacterium]|nr:ferrochelatase [Rhodospirillales bacterium]